MIGARGCSAAIIGSQSPNCEWSENPNRMPTSVNRAITSHPEVRHPLTATYDVILCAVDDLPLGLPETLSLCLV